MTSARNPWWIPALLLLLAGIASAADRTQLGTPQLASPPPADAAPTPSVPGDRELPKTEGHWGEDALGFRWVEGDSEDTRWRDMDTGPFLASSLPTPVGMVTKSIAIRVGDARQASVCFDSDTMSLTCGWRDQFLDFTASRFGVIETPRIAGPIEFKNVAGPAWGEDPVRYRGLYLDGPRVLLSYEVAQVPVLESPWVAPRGDKELLFLRTFLIGPSDRELVVQVADAEAAVQVLAGDATIAREEAGSTRLKIPASSVERRIVVGLARAINEDMPAAATEAVAAEMQRLARPRGGVPRWPDTLTTRGVVGEEEGGLAVDTIRIPFDNPYRALMFIGGHDFFSQAGRAAVSTMHGDVWTLDGLDADLREVHWRRFATGLFQPLGLRIVDDIVYVQGRDRITRLHDLNGDGEADYYESLNNDAPTSAGGHDFAACLETDAAGNFYYVNHAGVHRVARDGSRWEHLATGLRNSNGLGVGPGDVVTVAPQEGEWTPASAIYEVTRDGYYGYGGPRVTPTRPRGYDPPLCWIPRLVDNSTGGQVWVSNPTWGALQGQMLSFSFGQCRMLLTLLEPRSAGLPAHWPIRGSRRIEIPDSDTSVAPGTRFVQGGSLPLPANFESGAMRGRFSPWDGHLYVSGLRGWVSAAVMDGCLQRVRRTPRPLNLLTGVRTLANGIALTFSDPLDPMTAEDPDSYDVQQWNYDYGAHYGSREFKVSQPGVEGHDTVEIQSATLLDDRTVFLQIPAVQPVMQMAISYVVQARDGATLRNTYYHTIHVVPDTAIEESSLRQPDPSRQTRVRDEDLVPGLVWYYRPRMAGGDERGREDDALTRAGGDVVRGRLAALAVPAGESPTRGLPPGAFVARAAGFLHQPMRDNVTFSLEGTGRVRLLVDDQEVFEVHADDLGRIPRRTMPLAKGNHKLELLYASPLQGDARLRVEWSGSTFGTETIPATSLFHRPADAAGMEEASAWRRGAELVDTGRCARCHGGEAETPARVEYDAPDLRSAGRRLTQRWIMQWLADPTSLRHDGEMPRMLDARHPPDRQHAADLAAYLSAESDASHEAVPEASGVAVSAGETLYQDLRCAACHRWTAAGETDEYQRLPLALAGSKFQPGALARYLAQPHAHYASNRMPDFRLSTTEAQALADYLLDRQTAELAEWTGELVGDAARGRATWVTLGCQSCHQGPEAAGAIVPRAAPLKSLARFDAGCLSSQEPVSTDDARRSPRYAWSDEDRAAVVAWLRRVQASERRGEAARHAELGEAAESALRRWQCGACHERDAEQVARVDALLEEGDGRPPELLPNLTWAGEKLKQEWVVGLLRGEHPERSRPWLRARMPAFPQAAEVVAAGLARQHGMPSGDPPLPPRDAQLADLGQRLTQPTGLDCGQCHGIGAQQPRGDERTQIAQGINLALTRNRLRGEFFQRFALDPARYDIRTKMPRLATDGRRTKVVDILEGDAARQFRAIWHYLQHLPEAGNGQARTTKDDASNPTETNASTSNAPLVDAEPIP